MGCSISTLQPTLPVGSSDTLKESSSPVKKTLPHRNTAIEDQDFITHTPGVSQVGLEHLPHLLGHPSSALHGYALGCEVQAYAPVMKLFVGLAKLTYESKMLKAYRRNPIKGAAKEGFEQDKVEHLVLQEVHFLRRMQELVLTSSSISNKIQPVNMYKSFLVLEDLYLTKDEAFLVMDYCNVVTLENFCQVQQRSLQASKRSSTTSNPEESQLVLEEMEDVVVEPEDSDLDLHRIAKKVIEPYFKDEDLLNIFSQIVNIVLHSHQRGIVLRNLSARNFSIQQTLPSSPSQSAASFDIKVMDVSMAIDVDNQFQWNEDDVPFVQDHLLYGQLEHDLHRYLAPELLAKQTKGSCASDIWALGVLLHHMYTGCYPTPTTIHTAELDCMMMTSSNKPELDVNVKLADSTADDAVSFLNTMPMSVQCLMYQMLCYHPENRISLTEVAKKVAQLRDGIANGGLQTAKKGKLSSFSMKKKTK